MVLGVNHLGLRRVTGDAAAEPGAAASRALSPDALLEGRTANDLLHDIVDAVAAPRS